MFFILLILILLAVITIWNSKLEIAIENLDISTERKGKVKKDFNIYIGIIIWNKIELLKINSKKLKNRKINIGAVLEKAKQLEEKSNKTVVITELIKSLKHAKFEIKKANVRLELGTEDAAVTAILVGIVSSILGIILRKQKFQILPIYQDKNILKLKLDCIFRINLIHYIYRTIMKGRDKNERKPSNRRAYAYSNE